MADDEIKRINIIISSAEDIGPLVRIRDHNKRPYSFFKQKKDGGDTAAFLSFQNRRVGDTIEIAYKEVPYKDTTVRNIVNIADATGEPQTLPAPGSQKVKNMEKPGREYWEKREANRQSSILLQVAFKSAVALEIARIRSGGQENQERVREQTLEFYDWLAGQIDEEQDNQPGPRQGAAQEAQEDELV